jgi:excisionase family DNA binding protein
VSIATETENDAVKPVSPGYLSAKSAATYSGLSIRTVWRLLKDGRLRAFRVGGRVLIRLADLDAMIQGAAESVG